MENCPELQKVLPKKPAKSHTTFLKKKKNKHSFSQHKLIIHFFFHPVHAGVRKQISDCLNSKTLWMNKWQDQFTNITPAIWRTYIWSQHRMLQSKAKDIHNSSACYNFMFTTSEESFFFPTPVGVNEIFVTSFSRSRSWQQVKDLTLWEFLSTKMHYYKEI